MTALAIELKKCKRTGFLPLMLAVGILGAAYAFLNFTLRKETLLSLPLSPMDILLTQLYGMIMVLNMFGLIAAACIIYNVEFKGNAVKKLYMLPVSVTAVYVSKFTIMSVLFAIAVCLQNWALAVIGAIDLPTGAFDLGILISFAGYSFLTSLPVLSFMLFVSSRIKNVWITLGIGVVGFLSGMALATSDIALSLVSPFVVMLKPAVAMSAQPDTVVVLVSLIETILFFAAGLWCVRHLRYE